MSDRRPFKDPDLNPRGCRVNMVYVGGRDNSTPRCIAVGAWRRRENPLSMVSERSEDVCEQSGSQYHGRNYLDNLVLPTIIISAPEDVVEIEEPEVVPIEQEERSHVVRFRIGSEDEVSDEPGETQQPFEVPSAPDSSSGDDGNVYEVLEEEDSDQSEKDREDSSDYYAREKPKCPDDSSSAMSYPDDSDKESENLTDPGSAEPSASRRIRKSITFANDGRDELALGCGVPLEACEPNEPADPAFLLASSTGQRAELAESSHIPRSVSSPGGPLFVADPTGLSVSLYCPPNYPSSWAAFWVAEHFRRPYQNNMISRCMSLSLPNVTPSVSGSIGSFYSDDHERREFVPDDEEDQWEVGTVETGESAELSGFIDVSDDETIGYDADAEESFEYEYVEIDEPIDLDDISISWKDDEDDDDEEVEHFV